MFAYAKWLRTFEPVIKSNKNRTVSSSLLKNMLLLKIIYWSIEFMNRKIIPGFLFAILMLGSSMGFAYNSDEVNRRLISCTPTKNLNAGNSTLYQITGLTGSTCVFKIDYSNASAKPGLICKVPYARMREMTSINPLTVQRLKNQFCVMSIKSLNKSNKIYR